MLTFLGGDWGNWGIVLLSTMPFIWDIVTQMMKIMNKHFAKDIKGFFFYLDACLTMIDDEQIK